MAKKVVTWDCPGCSISYPAEYQARECCEEEIESETNWECEKCENMFDTEHKANECCANKTLDKFASGEKSE